MSRDAVRDDGPVGWEHFAHGADIGVRGVGRSMADAFAQAALALTAVIVDPRRVASRDAVTVTCDAPTPDLLFVDWLNAVIYEMATRRMLFGTFDVRIDGEVLRAELRGERVDRGRHEPAVEIKGATHTALRVAQGADGRWIAETVVDV